MEQKSTDKYAQAIAASTVTTDDAAVAAAVKEILDKHLAENQTKEVYTFLFNTIDLTTLKSTDSPESVARFTAAVNDFEERYPELPNVAAICVYPNFAAVVRTVLEVSGVKIACVSGAFPSSQSFEEVKIAETSLAVANGADEIDIVFNLGYYLDNDYESVVDEITEQKEACRGAHLKVILETGALRTAENIRNASVLSLYSGARLPQNIHRQGISRRKPRGRICDDAVHQGVLRAHRTARGLQVRRRRRHHRRRRELLHPGQGNPRRGMAHQRALPHRRFASGQQPAERHPRRAGKTILTI